jgi:hypothetical protein
MSFAGSIAKFSAVEPWHNEWLDAYCLFWTQLQYAISFTARNPTEGAVTFRVQEHLLSRRRNSMVYVAGVSRGNFSDLRIDVGCHQIAS